MRRRDHLRRTRKPRARDYLLVASSSNLRRLRGSVAVHDPALGSNRDKRFARTRFDVPASRFLDTGRETGYKVNRRTVA